MNKSKIYSDKAYKLADTYGYLPYMIERYLDLMGNEETEKFLMYNEKELLDTIRLNSIRCNISRTENLLESKGVWLEKIEKVKEGRVVKSSPVPIGATPEYLNGYYMLQGKNSMYPSLILSPDTHDLVGDLTAAPGGKTSHLAQLMKNQGKILALDVSANRCRSLRSNLSRMGVSNTIVLNMDSRNIRKLGIKFDKILLDAPCSGSGVIIHDETRKTSKNLTDVLEFTSIQTELLSVAIDCLIPNGELVYCTCSLEPEENELVISNVLNMKDLSLINIGMDIGEPGLTRFQSYNFASDLIKAKRLYPHKSNGEGFFIAKMVKNR